ncbi:MAG: Antitoxin VapB1 [Pseudomonadota bacterium]|jgi:antitoxin VapB
MTATAKIFTSGNSQAIRLPKAFRVDVSEMWISKNEVTGEITLKPKDSETQRRRKLEALFKMLSDHPFPEDFSFRDESTPVEYPRNPFEDWTEETPAPATRPTSAT